MMRCPERSRELLSSNVKMSGVSNGIRQDVKVSQIIAYLMTNMCHELANKLIRETAFK